MLRVLLLSAILFASLVPIASAAPPGCGPYGCGGPTVHVGSDGVCAGFASAHGGTAVCVDRDEGVCVISAGEFWYNRDCTGHVLAP